MALHYRVKCTVSITAGAIVQTSLITGFKGLPADVNGVAYLLEDGTGKWEIGTMRSLSTRTMEESGPISSSGFWYGDYTSLTFSIIAHTSSYIDSLSPERALSPTSDQMIAAKYVNTPDDSSSVGYKAVAAHDSETALGHYMLPHTSMIPVLAEYTVEAPTLWKFSPITSVDGYANIGSGGIFSLGFKGPITLQGYEYFAVRVRGTVMANTLNDVDTRVFDVDYMTYKGAVLYNASAIKATVGTAGIVLGVATDGTLEINPGSSTSLRVRGVLRIDKIPFAVS